MCDPVNQSNNSEMKTFGPTFLFLLKNVQFNTSLSEYGIILVENIVIESINTKNSN